MEREIVRVDVWDYWFSGEYKTFAGFVADVTKALASVPEAHRASVVFESDSGGTETPPYLRAYYEREETDEEVAKREREEQRYRDEREDAERATFERLRRKFEAPSGAAR